MQPSGYPTNFFTNIQTPRRTEGLSPMARSVTSPTPCSRHDSDVRGHAPNHTMSRRPSSSSSASKGSRAVRTVVGAPFGSDQANDDVAPVQSKVVETLVSPLDKVA